MNTFKVGDEVKWTSQSGGYTKEKIGTIVMILKEDDTPYKIANKMFPYHTRMFDGWGIPGNAKIGYFVEVKGKTERSRKKHG